MCSVHEVTDIAICYFLYFLHQECDKDEPADFNFACTQDQLQVSIK